jgi:hypothetical protein
MSILNKTAKCDCGRPKDARNQWCHSCYEVLTPLERDEYCQFLSQLRHILGVLQKKIIERRAKHNPSTTIS